MDLRFLHMNIDSSRIGCVAEIACALKLTEQDYPVFQPFGNFLPYDLIADVNGVLIKIQVKSARLLKDRKRKQALRCESQRKTYKKGRSVRVPYKKKDFDFAACYFPLTEEFFIVPFDQFTKGSDFNITESKRSLYCNAWHLLEEFAASQARWCERLAFNPISEESDSPAGH